MEYYQIDRSILMVPRWSKNNLKKYIYLYIAVLIRVGVSGRKMVLRKVTFSI